jgi:hypothetical protein
MATAVWMQFPEQNLHSPVIDSQKEGYPPNERIDR